MMICLTCFLMRECTVIVWSVGQCFEFHLHSPPSGLDISKACTNSQRRYTYILAMFHSAVG